MNRCARLQETAYRARLFAPQLVAAEMRDESLLRFLESRNAPRSRFSAVQALSAVPALRSKGWRVCLKQQRR